MTHDEFGKLIERRITAIRDVLASKQKEYATDLDPLHNFRVGAAFSGDEMERVCWGFLLKHLVSLNDMVRAGVIEFPLNQWREKIGDSINYLILLEAIVEEVKRPATPFPM